MEKITKKEFDFEKFLNDKDIYLQEVDGVNGIEYELSSFTNNGVEMGTSISKSDCFNDFIKYADGFDENEEFRVHYEYEDFRNSFSVIDAIEDFIEYRERIKEISDQLKNENTWRY